MKSLIAAIPLLFALSAYAAEPVTKIELIFTCTMYAGDNIKPAKGYEIVEVRAFRGRDSSMTVYVPTWPFAGVYEQTRESPSAVEVVMRRSATPGERIEPPKGCTIEVKP